MKFDIEVFFKTDDGCPFSDRFLGSDLSISSEFLEFIDCDNGEENSLNFHDIEFFEITPLED